MLSVPRTRLSVRDARSARRPSRTPLLLRLRSKFLLLTNLGGAEVETGGNRSAHGLRSTTPCSLQVWLGGSIHPGRVVWNVSGAYNGVRDQGNAPSSSSPSLSLGGGLVKGPRKKGKRPTLKAKQWHGALCDTKFPFYYLFLFFLPFRTCIFFCFPPNPSTHLARIFSSALPPSALLSKPSASLMS